MISSARQARLGVVAVALVFFAAMGVLGGRAVERHRGAGEPAADFSLRRLNGETVSLSALRGKVVVLVFSSDDSPLCSQYQRRVVHLAQQYAADERVQFLKIETSRQQPVEEMRWFKSITGQTFPTLLDPQGQVAAAYGVEVTPAVVVIDARGLIRYRGAFDDHRDEAQVRHQYCADALESLLSKRPITTTFTQAFGCPVQPK